jgi:hypothetical protein
MCEVDLRWQRQLWSLSRCVHHQPPCHCSLGLHSSLLTHERSSPFPVQPQERFLKIQFHFNTPPPLLTLFYSQDKIPDLMTGVWLFQHSLSILWPLQLWPFRHTAFGLLSSVPAVSVPVAPASPISLWFLLRPQQKHSFLREVFF